MNFPDRALRNSCQWLNWLACFALAIMMFLVVANVVLRIIYKPILGTYEIVGFLGALTISLGLAQTTLKNGHVAVDLFVMLFGKFTKRIIHVFSTFLSAFLFLMISWQSAKYALDLQKTGHLSQTLKIPYYPLIYVLSIASAIIFLLLIYRTIKSSMEVWRNN